MLSTLLKNFSVTFDAIFTYYFFEFEKALSNPPKIVQRKKYIKNTQRKMLNQYCANVLIFMFHSLGLAAAQIEILH